MIEGKNYTKTAIADISKDLEYRHCNFARRNCTDDAGDKKGHRLFPGDDTPRTFIGCNMVNCEPPPGSTCIRCNGAIFEMDVVVASDEIVIDGERIEQKDYAQIIYGRFRDGQYQYKTIPVEVPIKINNVKEPM
ncbi:hypothetical protein KAR91_50745 [Candidatus Pacearchaeota archaeon]|nr:hypothetical protein [Candidatus Pacearchaeota archaeon]